MFKHQELQKEVERTKQQYEKVNEQLLDLSLSKDFENIIIAKGINLIEKKLDYSNAITSLKLYELEMKIDEVNNKN